MADLSDPALATAVAEVRDDTHDHTYVIFDYADKTKIQVGVMGTGDHAEMMTHLQKDKVQYVFLRMRDGDQESQRTKFVFITWVGPNVGGIVKGRVAGHKMDVCGIVGQINSEFYAENAKECSEKVIRAKLKVAGGADYDTGSNRGGNYQKSTGVKERALENYGSKEKQGNIGPVVFVKHALPKTTPVDLAGRPMVAAAADAKKNTKDNVNDRDKFKGEVDKGTTAKKGKKQEAPAEDAADAEAKEAAKAAKKAEKEAAAAAKKEEEAKRKEAEEAAKAEAAAEKAAKKAAQEAEAAAKVEAEQCFAGSVAKLMQWAQTTAGKGAAPGSSWCAGCDKGADCHASPEQLAELRALLAALPKARKM